MRTYILGLSAYYHDCAAALVREGDIIAVAQEGFTRKKHDPSFPAHAGAYCPKEAGIRLADIDHIVFYEKLLVKFERFFEIYLANAPSGFSSFVFAI